MQPLVKNATPIKFENHLLFVGLCGIADTKIDQLEKMLNVHLIPRGHGFLIQSDNTQNLGRAHDFFREIQSQYPAKEQRLPEQFDIQYIFNQVNQAMEASISHKNQTNQQTTNHKMDYKQEVILTNALGYKIHPRTIRQAEYVDSVLSNEITICMGPAGTGKTFLSTAIACRLFQRGEVERIVLTRPAVEAGESLGFLPGDLTQKVDPYLRPLFDALYECLGTEKVNDLIDLRKIEIAPLAFMRGRTLNDSFVILDEGQNCTLTQLKMFMTRLGRNSIMCIGGDTTQVDLPPGKSGLSRSAEILEGIHNIGVVEFGSEDIIRNPLIEKIVTAFSRAEKEGLYV